MYIDQRRFATMKKFLLYAAIISAGAGLLFLLEETIRLGNTGFGGKTLWDWMDLFIVPVVLAFGAFFLNRSEQKTEREIATDRQQEAGLQTYLDRMAELLLKENLRTSKKGVVRDVARVRTLTVLRGLDGRRKGEVLLFLNEAGLINAPKPILHLSGADLSGAHLQGFDLSDTYLQGVNLRNAILQFAKMERADLTGSFLRDARLQQADLRGAILTLASLSGATMPDGTKHE